QRRPCTTKHTHGVLAMKAGDRDELVQNAPLLAPPALPVTLHGRSHQFITRHHAPPPHRCLSDPIRVGNISDEATAQYSGTFLARQCALSSRSSRYRRADTPCRARRV